MDLFREMKQFQTGVDEQGRARFSVPLQADEVGMVGRECPSKDCGTRYFKMSTTVPDGKGELSDATVTCPYCGHIAGMQQFHTHKQVNWVESMVVRDAEQTIVEELERMLKPLNEMGGLISIKAEVKCNLPSVRHYAEEKLKHTVTCDDCGYRFSVYGISFHCPLCGQGTIRSHLRENVATVGVLAGEANAIGEKHGSAVRDQMLGNAVEDVVSVFEGFLKQIYRRGVERKFPSAEAKDLVAKVRTNFQRLSGAEKFFLRDLNVGLFDGVTANERADLEQLFCKRHVLTHNLGMVDEKYLGQSPAWLRERQEVPVDATEVQSGVSLVERVVTQAAATLGL